MQTGARVLSMRREAGQKVIETEDTETGVHGIVRVEEILLAAGIRPNSDLLRPERAGLRTNARGFIETNEYLETSAKNIYAIGDINGKFPFRHKANYEASVLSSNLFGKNKTQARYDHVPWAIFTHPQTAHVGMTEKEAKEKGLRVFIGRNYYSEVAGGIAMGYSQRRPGNGFAKIVAGADRHILGVHIAGPWASVLLQPFVHMMDAGFTCGCEYKPKEQEGDHLTVKVHLPAPGHTLYLRPIHGHPSLAQRIARLGH